MLDENNVSPVNNPNKANNFIKNCMDYVKNNRNVVLVGIAVIAIVIVGGLIFANKSQGFTLPTIFGMSDQQIGQKTIDYINTNGLSSTPASLVKVAEESGLVKVTIKIGANSFDSYATKDGKLLFPQAFTMTAAKKAITASNTPAQTAASVTKVAKPVLEAFVVSSCPYGLQMQRAMVEAVKTAPALASSLVVRYIGSITNGQVNSMHDSDASGKAVSNGPEAQENLRQICLREEQPTKFWNYLSCYMQKASGTLPNGMPLGDSKGCLTSTGVDTAKLSACVKDPSRGLAYAQKDFAENTKYNVSGSPTLVLDGTTIDETNFGGRSADAMRAIICAASTTQPGLCSKPLNTAAASVSFNATYANTTGGSGSGSTQCGTAQ